ncbi:MAG: hypothetical protein U0414_15715 [Polyangiaceae bacterium]
MRPVARYLSVCAALMIGSAALASSAEAQEIQLTGPLAGAPATRHQRLHRAKRFEISPNVTFTLLDEYQRTIMPGLKLTYHLNDWFGLGVWGGYGFQLTTGLSDELQDKAITQRNCFANPSQRACQLTAVSLTHRQGASLADDQLGKFQFTVAPQLTFVPFRGKIALFGALFVDTDVSLFVGGALVGLQQRAHCGTAGEDTGDFAKCSDPKSFVLESKITGAPTFGLGLNFYPTAFFGFGAEFRGMPFAWNTSGFDVLGSAVRDGDFPDQRISSDDDSFHFNSMVSINLSFQLPPKLDSSP